MKIQQWEYHLTIKERGNYVEDAEFLNKSGELGWELCFVERGVSLIPNGRLSDGYTYMDKFYFKRQKSTD